NPSIPTDSGALPPQSYPLAAKVSGRIWRAKAREKAAGCSVLEAVHHPVQAFEFVENPLSLALQLLADLFERRAVVADLLADIGTVGLSNLHRHPAAVLARVCS